MKEFLKEALEGITDLRYDIENIFDLLMNGTFTTSKKNIYQLKPSTCRNDKIFSYFTNLISRSIHQLAIALNLKGEDKPR